MKSYQQIKYELPKEELKEIIIKTIQENDPYYYLPSGLTLEELERIAKQKLGSYRWEKEIANTYHKYYQYDEQQKYRR